MSATPASRPGERWLRPRRWLRAAHWYLRELTGEADYERYLAHHAAAHPDAPALTRRAFQEWRWAEKAATPGNRCC